jgi:hypothetical protein
MFKGTPTSAMGKRHFPGNSIRQRFALPPMNVRGNSGLGTIRGSGQNNVDISLAKTFIHEGLFFELRGDAFNAFNHSQWNGINTTYPSGSAQYPFGQVNGARGARIGQVGVKLFF